MTNTCTITRGPDGLLGTLQQRAVWCSHIFYLNDVEENLNGWKVFFDEFDQYSNGKKDLPRFKALVNESVENWRMNINTLGNENFQRLQIDKWRYFVFSLSLVPDDLSQWRSYTPASFGFCIHFMFDKTLNEYLPSKNFLFAQCLYEEKEKRAKIKGLLDYYFGKFSKKMSGWDVQLYFDVLTLNLFFKNQSFESEKECRLVIRLDEGSDGAIKMRPGKSFLIPYIEVKDIDPRFVKGVLIGPTPYPQHSKSSVQLLIRNSRFQFEPLLSKIPFRSW